jgi:hypothetical protein
MVEIRPEIAIKFPTTATISYANFEATTVIAKPIKPNINVAIERLN